MINLIKENEYCNLSKFGAYCISANNKLIKIISKRQFS